jgi:integrase
MALSDVRIRATKPQAKPYKLGDTGSLYLLVTPTGSRYWRLDYRLTGKRKTLALGVYPTISLSTARSRRDEARALLAGGIDPSTAKKTAKVAAKTSADNTFEVVGREWLEKQHKRFVPAYLARLEARLEADVFPQIGHRPIDAIDAPELLKMLRKVEGRGVIETTRRLKQLCGSIFRYAIVTGRAKRDPSAALKGALKSPGRPRGRKAMPMSEMPSFMAALEKYDGDPRTRLALKLMVLVFVGTNELRAARWCEFENLDGNAPLWRIPAERMKMKVEHLVPLAPQAAAVLRELRELPGSDDSPLLFPSASKEGCMSNNTMLFAMYRLGYHSRASVHGFRTTASTALNEMGFRPDVIEAQLAHQEQNAVRRAYNFAQYLDERRAMMTKWADHLDAIVDD